MFMKANGLREVSDSKFMVCHGRENAGSIAVGEGAAWSADPKLCVGIHQETRITEQAHREFRDQFFDITNHAQFVAPDGNTSDGADFGRVVPARDPRLVQFALNLFF